jgi:hypothetical protein
LIFFFLFGKSTYGCAATTGWWRDLRPGITQYSIYLMTGKFITYDDNFTILEVCRYLEDKLIIEPPILINKCLARVKITMGIRLQ